MVIMLLINERRCAFSAHFTCGKREGVVFFPSTHLKIQMCSDKTPARQLFSLDGHYTVVGRRQKQGSPTLLIKGYTDRSLSSIFMPGETGNASSF